MNKRLKQALKFTGRFILGIFAFIVLYVLMAFILAHIPVNSNPEKSDEVAIYINSNGVHTDIIVPIKNDVKDWTQEIRYDQTKSKDSIMEYIAFGWGDKGFYLETPEWSDLKASTAFKAAFYLSTSAMHTRFYNEVKEDDECVKVTISKKDYQYLVKYIEDSFALDADNKVQWIANQSYGQYDAFYEANRKYSLFYTCNTWANNALKAAHQKAALWTPYDKGIFYHYQ
jgi:uncharacterized protein (TIGR02117 family)